VNGPDAPDVTIQELDREIILMWTNDNPASNNYHELYSEFDPSIPEELLDGTALTLEDRSYRFEGYMVYQLKDAQVSNAELGDINKARLIAQYDIQNEVAEIINYNVVEGRLFSPIRRKLAKVNFSRKWFVDHFD
jgi:hypothetical protein